MITQEQANAIAEREYPYPIESMPWYNYNQTRIEVGFLRIAYAKCLMDLNALIEALEGMIKEVEFKRAVAGGMGHFEEAYKASVTALSNLTKKIEP